MSEPRPANWMQDHLERYLESGGEDGHIWNGVPTLLLTTKGRKSGQPRQLPLIYGKDEENCVIVGSRGGSPHHPSWYLNLAAEPVVQVQVKGDRFTARARTAEGAERERLWNAMAEIFPNYNVYASSTPRLIPVVVLERL